MKISRSILALGAFFVLGAGIAACGSDVPGNSVADMAGNPVTTQAFNHWMYVAAKGNAAQGGPGSPVVVPTDPPRFNGCKLEETNFKDVKATRLIATNVTTKKIIADDAFLKLLAAGATA